MGRATPREIMQSMSDHAQQQADQGKRTSRHTPRTGSYTSESPRSPQGTPGAFGKGLADGSATTYVTQGGHTKQAVDSRDRYWASLGKQVAAGARITVRG